MEGPPLARPSHRCRGLLHSWHHPPPPLGNWVAAPPYPPPPPPGPQIAIDWLTSHHIYTAEQIAQIEANVVKLQARATAIATKWRSLKSLNSRGKC